MNWKLPNQLTVCRIGLAAVFFVLLGLFQPGTAAGPGLLISALVVFVVAGVTDFLDGYIARKMHVESAFGRVVDPFVDKVLIVGAFAMLAGSNFLYPSGTCDLEDRLPHWLTGGMLSVVQAWMVVAVLAREFIVSAIRGYSESCGKEFPATYAGKIKMIVQLFAIGTVLVQIALLPEAAWAIYMKVAMVWLAVVVTVVSGLAYVEKARKLMILEPTD